MNKVNAALPVVLITLLGALLRFWAIGSKSVWLDEAFSIWIANHPPAEIWAWLIQIDQHPPLHYVLLHYWQLGFGDLQGAVRSFSALCGSLAIPFVYCAATHIGSRRVGLVAALILAISPFHIRFGQEARMYALLTLGVAATLCFATHLLFAARTFGKKRWGILWVGLVVAEAAVLWTHNTAAIFFPVALNGAVGGFLLWGRAVESTAGVDHPRFARQWLLAQAAVFVLWLPWLWPFVQQSIGVDSEFWIAPPTRDSIRWTFHNFNFFYLPKWVPFYGWWGRVYWAIAALAVVWIWRTPRRVLLLWAIFLLPPILSLLVSLRRPIFYDRTLIWITLPYAILLALGVDWLAQTARVLLRKVALLRPLQRFWNPLTYAPLLLVVVLSGSALHNYYNYFDKEEWDVAAAHVAARMQPEDLVLFNATWVQIPFEYYLRHFDREPRLRGLPVDLFDRGVLEPKMSGADLGYMRELIANEQDLWLVYSHDWYTDEEQIILRELDRSMRRVEGREFVGLRVFRYERK